MLIKEGVQTHPEQHSRSIDAVLTFHMFMSAREPYVSGRSGIVRQHRSRDPRFQQFDRLPCMHIEIDRRTTERHIHPSLDASSHFAVRTLLEADAIGALQENNHDIINAML